MTTKKRAAANRANTKKSTGPKTSTGKQVSSMNAVKHGPHSKPVLAMFENTPDYANLFESLVRELVPIGPLEHYTLRQIARIFFQQDRLANYERGRLNQSLMERFFRGLGAWIKTAEPEDIEKRFEKFLELPHDYDLPIDEQTKTINNACKLDVRLDRLLKQLADLKARPSEDRSRGAWMEPMAPLAASLAEHADREWALEAIQGDARKAVQAQIRLMKGLPSWETEGTPPPLDDPDDDGVDEDADPAPT